MSISLLESTSVVYKAEIWPRHACVSSSSLALFEMRCEICHAEYAFVPDLAAALRFRLRI